MIEAARDGRLSEVEALLRQGVDLRFENDTGESSLALAAANGHSEVVRILLEAGARTEDSSGGTALVRAAESGNLEIVQVLLAAGADAYVDTSKVRGGTALAVAESADHLEVAKAIREWQREWCEREIAKPGAFGLQLPAELQESRRALETEKKDPAVALVLFRGLQKRNVARRPDILMLCLGAPVLAMALAFHLTRTLADRQSLVALLILFFVGYYPPVLWACRWMTERQRTAKPRDDDGSWLFPAIQAILIYFERALVVFFIVLFALVFALPCFVLSGAFCHLLLGTPWLEPPEVVKQVIAVAALGLGLLVVLSDVDWKLLFQLRIALPELVAGLRHRIGRNLKFLLVDVAVASVLVGAGPLGLLYDHLFQATAGAALAGGLLGLTLWQLPRDPRLDVFAVLGIARCEIRLGRRGAARWRLRMLLDYSAVDLPEVGGSLGRSLLQIAAPQAQPFKNREIVRGLDRAAEEAHGEREHRLLWAASVENSRSLLTDLGSTESAMRKSLITVLFIALPFLGAALRYDGSFASFFIGIIGGLICGASLFIPICCILGEFAGGAKLSRRILIGWCLGGLVYGIYLIVSGQLLNSSMVSTFEHITQTFGAALIVAGSVVIYHRGV